MMMSEDETGRDLLEALRRLETPDSPPPRCRAPQDMRAHIRRLEQLPPLPEMARRILALRNDRHSDAQKLAKIVEMDPSLASQVIRWSNSSIYGFRGRIPSVKDAITLVLGYEQVFNLAFALCSLRPFRIPTEGPLGKRYFWRQTLAGSALLQKLTRLTEFGASAPTATVHLVYLLHNFGHLLLAHLFPEEFAYLTRSLEANPEESLITLERQVLKSDHTQLGAWLMHHWALPDYLAFTATHHHNPHYRGDHETLIWITCLTDRLLGEIGIGDACNVSADNVPLFQNLSIEPAKARACLAEIEQSLADLDQAVNALL